MKRIPKRTLGCLAIGLTAAAVHAAPSPAFKHVIVIFQENRTPDNLFHDLINFPGVDAGAYDLMPNAATGTHCTHPQALAREGATQPDPSECVYTGGTQKKVCLTPTGLAVKWDPSHSHCGFMRSYDDGKMDGASLQAKPDAGWNVYQYVSNADGGMNPYFEIARDYGFANRMFQTNQGPSFPAHQIMFGGTSAPTDPDDDEGIFVSGNPGGRAQPGDFKGCEEPDKDPLPDGGFPYLPEITPQGADGGTCAPGCTCFANGSRECRLYNSGTKHQFCFDRVTLPNLLEKKGLDWRYYSPMPGSIWTAPHSIKDKCNPDYSKHPPVCQGAPGSEWSKVKFDLSQVIGDVGANCASLPAVTWIIPDGACSDHPNDGAGWGGPGWVSSIVNAIGKSSCWKDTAVIVTWDDWGGWYDHVKPPKISGKPGDYELGFRVPLLVVSPQTAPHTVSNTQNDFGSILRFIESNFGLPLGGLGHADARATTQLDEFFNQKPGPFRPIKSAPPSPPSICTPAPGHATPPDGWPDPPQKCPPGVHCQI